MIITDTESADVPTPTGPMRTYLFRPVAEGRYPGLVLSQIKEPGVFSAGGFSSRAVRGDGMSCGDYPPVRLRTGPSTKLRTGVEQLTYLLFLKMADERDSMAESVVS